MPGAIRASGAEVVLPQRHVLRVLGHELPREAPADAGVAVVVDDPAENVPAEGCEHEESMAGRASHYRAPPPAAAGIMSIHDRFDARARDDDRRHFRRRLPVVLHRTPAVGRGARAFAAREPRLRPA